MEQATSEEREVTLDALALKQYRMHLDMLRDKLMSAPMGHDGQPVMNRYIAANRFKADGVRLALEALDILTAECIEEQKPLTPHKEFYNAAKISCR